MQRWIARLLVLVMGTSVFGPLAMARAAQPEAPHCERQAAKPATHCHGGMTMAPESSSSETSLRAADSCCENHDCCRGMASPRWAQPQAQLGANRVLALSGNVLASIPDLALNAPADNDSARAPPRR